MRAGVLADQPASGLYAIASKPSFMGRMPSTPWYRASSKLQLAEQLARNHAFQALEIVLRQLEGVTLSETEDARYRACVGEIKWAEGNFEEAVALFQYALEYPLRDTRAPVFSTGLPAISPTRESGSRVSSMPGSPSH